VSSDVYTVTTVLLYNVNVLFNTSVMLYRVK
jgi:hypothetical protein